MSDHIPPIICRGPINQTFAVDSTAQLQCYVTGNPVPSIQWLKDGQKVVGSDPRVSLLDNGTLQITNLQVGIVLQGADLLCLPPAQGRLHQKAAEHDRAKQLNKGQGLWVWMGH